jgi:hypothetical protein
MRGQPPAIAIVLALCALSAPVASASPDDLIASHRRLRDALQTGPFDVPLALSASLDGERIGGDVYAVLEQPFLLVSRELVKPAAWCDILTLHFNVKSCHAIPSPSPEAEVRAGGAHTVELRIATARKYYVPPSGRNPMTYRLDVAGSGPNFLHASLTADKAPLGVRDLLIEVEAIPLPEGGSFVHLHYAYTAGWAVRMASRTYLATLGRRKLGFTVIGQTPEGEPIYIAGREGAVERNALRYHLAIAAYLDTLSIHEAGRFEARIAHWYDLTDRYKKQLEEMSQDAYLDLKRRERRDMEDQAGVGRVRRRR